MKKVKFPAIILALLFIASITACEKELDENILGVWFIKEINVHVESLEEPHTTYYVSPRYDVGKIFFRSTGNGVLEIEDPLSSDIHELGIINFQWKLNSDTITIDDDQSFLITEIGREKMTMQRIINYEENRNRLVYSLER